MGIIFEKLPSVSLFLDLVMERETDIGKFPNWPLCVCI